MLLALILSSIVAGAIATTVMVMFLYLPLLWGGVYYDTLGAIGSMFTRKVDGRSRVIGGIILTMGGLFLAIFYGAFVLMLEIGPLQVPDYKILKNWPVEVNLIYPLLGLALGFGQGMFVSLITSFIFLDFHPLELYKDHVGLVLSYIIGHTIYGVVVIFFQSQFLQLLMI